jgi:Mce-associated membrane protein
MAEHAVAADELSAEPEGEVNRDDDAVVGSGDAQVFVPQPRSVIRLTLAGALIAVLALGGLVGWLGYRVYEGRQADQQRSLFIQVGRQAALNLTTIKYTEAEANVQRIVDSAVGTFRDDFQKRSGPFIDVVKKAQSSSEGTIAEAGLLSEQGGEAQVLVAVTVKTSTSAAPEQEPRSWRMRISVQKVGDDAKVSNVEFVP